MRLTQNNVTRARYRKYVLRNKQTYGNTILADVIGIAQVNNNLGQEVTVLIIKCLYETITEDCNTNRTNSGARYD